MSNEQVRWLMKVIQPERTLAALPGGHALDHAARAGLLGLPPQLYVLELGSMQDEVDHVVEQLLADDAVTSMLDRLPLQPGTAVTAFGDSLTSDPQSWAVILHELLRRRRGDDDVRVTIDAVAGETTTHGLVRVANALRSQPDWILFLLGTNDARTQGPQPTKTLVHHEETARNITELRHRVAMETQARAIWITPPAVDEAKVATHAGLARFGVRFDNGDLERVAEIIRGGEVVVDAFSALGAPPAAGHLLHDGLHLTVAGQARLALEVLRVWSAWV
ncbi:acyl-CoA thioesterase-1 [Quadrisphaera granulorum]|uniref:Acyl-CoA thioesterase-1 n=1 Tax=Quadrisphaera granulorum TaxID=317664 RepID=A0A315ZPH0_9ACTN|nr:SGNH/GDSL hydrolase family protein [Quadrisphaera granulorum]PWJ46910.1 acyl-CoA thioesterase-1 [Quadrisphaera granulorum]SZE99002.1 acyl-CoA thioesterase-1 [Quadrisphaera granulorum]